MLEFKRRGAAIVFVSHNLQAVQALCERALYLKHKPIVIGPTTEVLHGYVKAGQPRHDAAVRDDAPLVALSSQLVDDGGNPVSIIAPGRPLTLLVDYRVQDRSRFPLRRAGAPLTDLLNVYDGKRDGRRAGADDAGAGQEFRVAFRFNANLVRRQYHLGVVIPRIRRPAWSGASIRRGIQRRRAAHLGPASRTSRCVAPCSLAESRRRSSARPIRPRSCSRRQPGQALAAVTHQGPPARFPFLTVLNGAAPATGAE